MESQLITDTSSISGGIISDSKLYCTHCYYQFTVYSWVAKGKVGVKRPGHYNTTHWSRLEMLIPASSLQEKKNTLDKSRQENLPSWSPSAVHSTKISVKVMNCRWTDTDELKMALRARKDSRAFEKQARGFSFYPFWTQVRNTLARKGEKNCRHNQNW